MNPNRRPRAPYERQLATLSSHSLQATPTGRNAPMADLHDRPQRPDGVGMNTAKVAKPDLRLRLWAKAAAVERQWGA
jgi:hypothetical protein